MTRFLEAERRRKAVHKWQVLASQALPGFASGANVNFFDSSPLFGETTEKE
jgi:hypothetical protein